jgi:NAD(P)-dependent dehydrogenase (short-subunit alcohol dehydrogenase family)
MTELTGKVAVVTGAGSGIGASTARLFALHGAKVHVADLDLASAQTVVAAITAAGGRAVAHQVDVTDAAAVESLAERVFASDGAVDLLHNNAGIGGGGDTVETPLEDWRAIMEVNVMGVVHGIHAFLPRLLAQGRPAHIVNTASAAGLFAAPMLAAYTTSKFAVVGLSESLHAELAPQGIRVSALCPGIIHTPITDRATMRGTMSGENAKITDYYRRRGSSPDVVAAAVLAAHRNHKMIIPVPRAEVGIPWLIKRVSVRALVPLLRFGTKQIRK